MANRHNVAYTLKNLNDYADQDIIIKHDEALEVINTPDGQVAVDGEGGRNLFGVAWAKAMEKGDCFMKEAVEDSQYFLVRRINDILIGDLRIMSVLSAQAKVAEFTPDQVKALSADAKAKYDDMMKAGGAKLAYAKLAELVKELCGKNGIIRQPAM